MAIATKREVTISKIGNTTKVKIKEKGQNDNQAEIFSYNEPTNLMLRPNGVFELQEKDNNPRIQFLLDDLTDNGGATTAEEYLDYAAENFFFYQE